MGACVCVCIPKSLKSLIFFPECDHIWMIPEQGCLFLFITIIYYIILYIFLLSYNFRGKSYLGINKIALKRNKLSS